MRIGDAQIGTPQILFKETKANIESMTGMVDGCFAFATDTMQLGFYRNSSWGWGGLVFVTEKEIDFGSTPVYDKTFTVTDSLCSTTSKILCYPSGNVATGRIGNDSEWDSISYSALSGDGSFTLTAICSTGAVVGKRKMFYIIM